MIFLMIKNLPKILQIFNNILATKHIVKILLMVQLLKKLFGNTNQILSTIRILPILSLTLPKIAKHLILLHTSMTLINFRDLLKIQSTILLFSHNLNPQSSLRKTLLIVMTIWLGLINIWPSTRIPRLFRRKKNQLRKTR